MPMSGICQRQLPTPALTDSMVDMGLPDSELYKALFDLSANRYNLFREKAAVSPRAGRTESLRADLGAGSEPCIRFKPIRCYL